MSASNNTTSIVSSIISSSLPVSSTTPISSDVSTSFSVPAGPSTVTEFTTTFSTFVPPGETVISSTPVVSSPVVETSVPLSTIPSSTPTVISFTDTVPGTTSIVVIGTSASAVVGSTTVVVVLTSTAPVVTLPPATTSTTTSSSAVSTTSGAAAISNSGDTASPSGLSPTARTAVAVVIPIVVVALLVVGALFFWRRRKQRKSAEELRRKEVEEYGYNPNSDPTIPAVAGGAAGGVDEVSEMRQADGSGYRGWGTTSSTTRKASTTMGSGLGMARSNSDSNTNGYNNPHSPTGVTNPNSDVNSGDTLIGPNSRPISGESDGVGALGAAGAVGMKSNQNSANNGATNGSGNGVHRGPSNASSAYSGGQRSDISAESGNGHPLPNNMNSPQYYNDALHYDDSAPVGMAYGSPPVDAGWGNGAGGYPQPVIRDVSARRNTRIEQSTLVPREGNVGISQNF